MHTTADQPTLSADAAPPAATLLRMMTGYWQAQAVYVAAKLGVPDLLADAPRSAESLAAATQTDADAMFRLLRALSGVGVFTEVSPRIFGLSPMAELLQSGTPQSMRALAMTYNEELYRAWGDLLYSIQTGKRAFDHIFGTGPFEYFAEHPEADKTFNEALVGYTNQVAQAVIAAYDFGSVRSVLDVGGGYGRLLATILQANPRARGVLFEQTHVLGGADALFSAAGVAERCTCVAGDFFVEIPNGADTYVLSQILHDWDDMACARILRNCRRAITSDGRLLIVEYVLGSGSQASFGDWLDLHMLVCAGGRERTATEYEALLAAADFRLERIVPTGAGPSVVEALPV